MSDVAWLHGCHVPGATSTMSAPTILSPDSPCRIFLISCKESNRLQARFNSETYLRTRVVKPPISGLEKRRA